MLLQRWEAKIRRKEKSPRLGIELTTTRSRVRHAHHWATQAGVWERIIPFTWHANFRLFQIQQQLKIWCQQYGQMEVPLSDRVENIVGKGEIARYEQFLLFPQRFQKLSVVDASKWVSLEQRVLTIILQFETMGLFCRGWRAESACEYAQSDPGLCLQKGILNI